MFIKLTKLHFSMDLIFQIILATFVISLISLSGAILFVFNEKKVSKFLILIVALAAGAFLGTAFFHLIPEAVEMHVEGEHYEDVHEELGSSDEHEEVAHEEEHNHVFLPSYFILLGILLFYVIEKFIHWHHHHDIDCHKHSLSTLSLIGDGIHNFIDGALIAAAFFVDTNLGIVTTIAIALHEIPQEIGDLAILLHSGMSKTKALFLNFLSAITAILGAVSMYFIANIMENYIPLMISFVAGTFIYLSLADIIPELNKKSNNFSQLTISLVFLIGIILSLSMSFIAH